MEIDPEKTPPHDPDEKSPIEQFKMFFDMLSGLGDRIRNLGILNKVGKIFSALEAKVPAPYRGIFKFRKWILIGLAVLIMGWMGLKMFKPKPKEAKVSLEKAMSEQKKGEEPPLAVKGFKIGRFNFEDSLNALGTIKGAMEFKLSFEVPGTISSINYKEGERYEEGALLVSLRQDDILLRLKRAQAEFNKAQTQTQIATDKVKEHEKLFAMGAIPKTTLDNVKLEADSSKFEGEAARLEVKANEAMLEKSNLYAPSAGMIGELSVEEGESITPNTLLGTHIMTEYVYAEFGVVERDVNKIALGQKARVFIDAYPDKTFEGVVENIAPLVTGTSRTATVRVRVENPERFLLPGMFARVRILLYSKKNTLVVPTDAIQGKEKDQFVYVLHLSKPPETKPKESAAPEGGAQMPEIPGMQQQPSQPTKEEPKKPAAPAPTAAAKAQDFLKNLMKKNDKNSNAKKGEEKPNDGNALEKSAEAPKEDKKADTVEKRAITVGYTRPDYSQIDAGISEGEIIAISGLEKLEDGKKIRLLETQEAEM